ncbi:transporter substrate-binding domain-containing protein [Arcobacter sp. CECT 8985]|uniref:transporter substrate-binding domain-containing protein n=1 Tax=Arcobacter sp. CECT 8985 TaxID=1935424 RepID=UPI00100AF6DB|nr:transporter substrate-binding domain-containing protein [Arcobacter sp. CECT 8985]RXJ86300.1 amino acid ABC transporter substrate-binding protein [Arcobacter sp. CECT 8985]
MIKKLLILVALLFCASSTFADDINVWKKSTLNQILQSGELRVGLDPGYMPFEMKDKRGRLIGYDIDLAKIMAKEMGVKLKIVPTTFDGIIAGLLTGKFDIIIAGMTITQKRNSKINFTDPYLVIGQTILLNKKYKDEIKSAKDLDNEKYIITAKLGQTGEIVARKFFKNAKINTFDTESEAVSEVLNNKAVAFVNDQPYNAVFMTGKGKNKLIHLDKPLTYEPLAFAIKKGDPDFLNWLNNFLRQIKNDKVQNIYEKLYKKWFVDTSWLRKVQ